MINHMVKSKSTIADVDAVFAALANDVRRGMVERLFEGGQTVSALGRGFEISPPAISRHLRVLEQAGVVSRERRGRTQLITLNPPALDAAMGWLGAHGTRWRRSLDALERVVVAPTTEEVT